MNKTDLNDYKMILKEQDNTKNKQLSFTKNNENVNYNENNLENFSKAKINK